MIKRVLNVAIVVIMLISILPIYATAQDIRVIAVSTASSYSMILKSDGSLWTCGSNTYGQLGNGTTQSQSEPVMIKVSPMSRHEIGKA